MTEMYEKDVALGREEQDTKGRYISGSFIRSTHPTISYSLLEVEFFFFKFIIDLNVRGIPHQFTPTGI